MTPPPVTPPPAGDDASIPIMKEKYPEEYPEKEIHGKKMMRVDYEPCDWWGR